MTDVVSVKDFGAVGGDLALDSAAFQAAVDTGKPVYVPRDAALPYLVANVQLPNACEIFGHTFGLPGGYTGQPQNFLINGDGVNPIFKAGVYGSGDTSRRYIRMHGLSAFNDGATCLQLHNSPDFRVFDNFFNSINLPAGEACVDIKYSVRGRLNHNRITGGGSNAWGLKAFDNCNGGDYSGNTITGGTLGGAVNVGQTQALNLQSTTIESCLTGFQISEEDGQCSAIDLSNFYIEQVRSPFRLGLTYALHGVRADNGYVGNSVDTVIAARFPCFLIGRVRGLHLAGGWFNGLGSEDLFRFYQSVSWPQQMKNSVLRPATRSGYANDIAFDIAMSTTSRNLVMSQNFIEIENA